MKMKTVEETKAKWFDDVKSYIKHWDMLKTDVESMWEVLYLLEDMAVYIADGNEYFRPVFDPYSGMKLGSHELGWDLVSRYVGLYIGTRNASQVYYADLASGDSPECAKERYDGIIDDAVSICIHTVWNTMDYNLRRFWVRNGVEQKKLPQAMRDLRWRMVAERDEKVLSRYGLFKWRPRAQGDYSVAQP